MALVKLTDEQLFGKDLLVSDAGDLDVVSVNGFTDLKVVSGRSNLRQAILTRLQTDQGDLPQHKEYGSRISQLVSEGMAQAKELTYKFVSAALTDDARIKSVKKTELKDTGNNSFDLEVVVELQDSETPLNLIMPAFLK